MVVNLAPPQVGCHGGIFQPSIVSFMHFVHLIAYLVIY